MSSKSEKKNVWFSKWVKFLTGIFSGTPIKWVKSNLIFDWYLHERLNWAAFPDQEKINVSYGTWVFHDELVNLLESEYMNATNFDDLRDKFRYDAAWVCATSIHPEYPEMFADWSDWSELITQNDLSEFLKIMSTAKIWNDLVVQANMSVARVVINSLHPSNADLDYNESYYNEINVSRRSEQEVMMQIDFNSDDLTWSPEFEALEKEQRKKRSNPNIHKYIDELDLTNFKKILRDEWDTPFSPKWWQSQMLITMRRFNYVAASRRAGKTMLAAYLILRQLMIKNQKVAIVVPTLKNHAKNIWDYLVTFTKLLQFDDEFKIDYVKSSRSCSCKGTWSSITFYSAKDSVAVRGATVNLLIVDEMAFVHEDSFKTASALIRTTRWMIYGISTVNKDLPKNYFYYQLVRAEVEWYDSESMYLWMRINLYNNPFISEEDKNDIIEDGKSDPDTFNAEWMASFADSKSLNLSKFWIVDETPAFIDLDSKIEFAIRPELIDPNQRSEFTRHIVSYDPAKRRDQPWLTITSFKNGTWYITLAWYLKWLDYMDQADVIYYLYEVMLKGKCDVVIDYTWVWVVVEEILRGKWIMVVPIQAVWWTTATSDWGVRRVWVDTLDGALAAKMELWQYKWYTFQKDMFYELEWYTPEMDRVKGHHFDIVSSMKNAAWYWSMLWYYYSEETLSAERKFMEEQFEGQWLDFDPWWWEISTSNSFERYSKCRY